MDPPCLRRWPIMKSTAAVVFEGLTCEEADQILIETSQCVGSWSLCRRVPFGTVSSPAAISPFVDHWHVIHERAVRVRFCQCCT